MLTYLEGARYKLQSALLELDHKPRGSHPLAPHVQITRDRTGLQQSILKVPLWLGNGDETDGLSESYCQPDLNANLNDEQAENNYAEAQNENLIKHFDRNFLRSQSQLGSVSPSTSSIGPVTISEHPKIQAEASKHFERRSKSPNFDRGIADGGSNQPDSDFGKTTTYIEY